MTEKLATFADIWPERRKPVMPLAALEALCPRTNKVRHVNRRHAEQRMATLRDDELMNVYRCWHCGDWHVGHVG